MSKFMIKYFLNYFKANLKYMFSMFTYCKILIFKMPFHDLQKFINFMKFKEIIQNFGKKVAYYIILIFFV